MTTPGIVAAVLVTLAGFLFRYLVNGLLPWADVASAVVPAIWAACGIACYCIAKAARILRREDLTEWKAWKPAIVADVPRPPKPSWKGLVVATALCYVFFVAVFYITLRLPAPASEPSPTAARIEIANIVGVPARSEAARPGFFLNVFYTNKGELPARSVSHRCLLVTTDSAMSTEQEMRNMDVAAAVPIANEPAGHVNEVQPGDPPQHYFSVPVKDDAIASLASEYQSVLSGKKRLYLFIAFKYKDRSTPVDKIRMTEFCGWFCRTFEVWHTCGRNRIYSEKAVRP